MNHIRTKRPKSPAEETAAALVGKLLDFADMLDEIEALELARVQPPGGGALHRDRWLPGNAVLTLLAEAGASEKDRRKLVRALHRIWDRARAYVTAIGDQWRAEGDAVPLCRLPGNDT
jgi:hypothetical protein